MADIFSRISMEQVLLAACIAYVIWYVLMHSQTVRNFLHSDQKEGERTYGQAELSAAGERCEKLFPIVSIPFQGMIFQRGMRVEVHMQPYQVIVGELIGMNKINLICIRTDSQILALRLEKIESMRCLSE